MCIIAACISFLSAAPIITRLEVCPPTEFSPQFLVYENVNGHWYVNDSHGFPGPCVEVRLTFTTEPGRVYHIECGSNEQPEPWEVGRPRHVVNQWRRVSLDIAGTGDTVTWTNGVPFSWQLFRVAVVP